MPLQGPPILAGSKMSSSRKTQKKEKAKLNTAKDRGPLWELDYAIADDGSENACDEGQPFREGPHSGGTSLQLQLQEYALKMVAKEGPSRQPHAAARRHQLDADGDGAEAGSGARCAPWPSPSTRSQPVHAVDVIASPAQSERRVVDQSSVPGEPRRGGDGLEGNSA